MKRERQNKTNGTIYGKEVVLLTEKELKKLRRVDLLELLMEESRVVERLQKEVDELREEAEQKRIAVEKAGSIAEASLRLTKVFDEAQKAAQLYLDNIERRSAEQDRISAAREEESRREADRLLAETAKKCREMEVATARRCRQMLDAAARKAEAASK